MSLVTIMCTSLVSAALGQQPQSHSGSPNIAVVDLTSLFDRFRMTRDLEDLFAGRRESITAEAESRRDDITFKRNELRQFKPGTADFQQREEALIQAEIGFQVWLEVEERRLKSEHKNWLQEIYKNVEQVIAKLAADRGIDLVLTYNALDPDAPDSIAFKQQILLRIVLYASDRSDLTNTVLARLDADYQKRGGPNTLRLGTITSKPATSPNPRE